MRSPITFLWPIAGLFFASSVSTALAVNSDVMARPALPTEEIEFEHHIFANGIAFPWSMSFLPDGRSLVTSRSGTLWLLDDDGTVLDDVTPDLSDLLVDGQAGLFEVAISPDFSRDQTVFLSYACGTMRANNTCLGKGFWNGDTLTDFHVIFRALPEKTGSAHYGARIAFLPDSTLLLTLGDGFDYREDAQRLENHLGTVVRLEKDGTVPTDNPLISNPKAKPEIYTYGHRNVQGIAWHPERQQVFVSEHGPRGGDEINLLRAGENYGWPLVTGGSDYTGARISPYRTLPGLTGHEFEWTPSIAPSGLMVYQGAMFSEWYGDFLVPALAAKRVVRMRYDEHTLQEVDVLFRDLDTRIRYILEHPETGALYLLTDESDGKIIKVTRK
ncbi:PQQ-dependent sugar dehydrogenase [Aliidiomarina sanyensis]|uniref:Glucose dehydrogenase n=1 Tax=Aliidiomarina sanyensis TaxID=1249555 RepID=A0A432WAQ5_9GAMM|nr:PQQ-dependent sugar dehydrogenase [Aliidiomarina sanyensis]RUO27460.1 glucose dehydrogenase [Aliidiomarina sanyensis]